MITVVVPCYNGEKWIRRCLKSILDQIYTDFEIIVINDGSTDHTVRVVEEIKDPHVRLINQINAGVSAARNRGIQEAKGEWIAFVDGDDYVENTYLQKLFSMLSEEALPVVGFGNNNLNNSILCDQIDGKYLIVATMPRDYLCGNLGQTIGFSCWNKLFSKKILMKHDIRFDTKLNLGEDMVFVFRYLCHCKSVVFCEDVQYHYCDNAVSAIHVSKDKSASYEETLNALSDMNENGYFIEEDVLCYWCVEVMTYILLNPYVAEMDFRRFREYLIKLKSNKVMQLAVRKKMNGTFRKRAMQWALKRKSIRWIFIMVKVQYYRRKGYKS